MNAHSNLQFLILESNDDLKEFEENIYYNFVERHPDKYIINEYFIEDKKARPKIPYSDLIIYAVKKNNKIIAGIALNKNMEIMQVKDISKDFNLPISAKCIEGIILFINDKTGENPFELAFNFRNEYESYLSKLGYECYIATCNKEKLKLYLKTGGELIGEVINRYNESEYIILRKLK